MNRIIYKNNTIKRLAFFGMLFVFLNTTYGQENLSMYYMNSIPLSTRLNPSTTHEFDGYFGGFLVPISGQILPPLNIGLSINSFAYQDVIYKPGGAYGDSSVTVFHDSIIARNFANGLSPVNRIDFHTYIDLLHFGFRTKNIFWNFSVVEKIEAGISFPKDLIRLPLYGLANFPSNTIDLNGLGASALHYREFGFGANYEYSSSLSFGVKAKVLFGMGNLNMKKTDIKWHIDPATGNFRFNTNLVVNTSQPVIDIKQLRYDTEGDSLALEIEERDFDPMSYALNMKNMGFAFDFGATYSPISNLKISAGVSDLGFIKWKDNVTNMTASGEFNFSGLNIVDLLDDSVDIANVLIDSLFNLMDVQLKHDSYITQVPLNIYVGGSYNLTDEISFGALYRGRKWFEEFQSSAIISANLNMRSFGAVVSYTAMKDNFNNLGVGIVFKLGGWQTFIMSDNVLDMIYPHTAREANIRFGTNWIIGSEKKHTALFQ